MIRPEVPAGLLERWLREVVEHPLEASEAQDGIRSVDYDDREVEFVLAIEENGVPAWWPRTHPKTRERLSDEGRRTFFLAWLSGVWNVGDNRIRRGAQSHRRRRLAIELVCLHAEIGEAWEQMPWDETL